MAGGGDGQITFAWHVQWLHPVVSQGQRFCGSRGDSRCGSGHAISPSASGGLIPRHAIEVFGGAAGGRFLGAPVLTSVEPPDRVARNPLVLVWTPRVRNGAARTSPGFHLHVGARSPGAQVPRGIIGRAPDFDSLSFRDSATGAGPAPSFGRFQVQAGT